MNREAEFITELHIEDIAEGREVHVFRLLADFRVYSAVLGAEITVPKGFVCDGESIPEWLRWLVPPFGESKRGAITHDYLYRFAGYHLPGGTRVPVTRAQADAVYKELVHLKGLPRWRTYVRHGILRLVGGFAWAQNLRHFAPAVLLAFTVLCGCTSSQRQPVERETLRIGRTALAGYLPCSPLNGGQEGEPVHWKFYPGRAAEIDGTAYPLKPFHS